MGSQHRINIPPQPPVSQELAPGVVDSPMRYNRLECGGLMSPSPAKVAHYDIASPKTPAVQADVAGCPVSPPSKTFLRAPGDVTINSEHRGSLGTPLKRRVGSR